MKKWSERNEDEGVGQNLRGGNYRMWPKYSEWSGLPEQGELMGCTEPEGEGLDCQEKLILHPLGNGESPRIFEQGNALITSLNKINLATI